MLARGDRNAPAALNEFPDSVGALWRLAEEAERDQAAGDRANVQRSARRALADGRFACAL
jgi:hypothetical protein